MYGVKVSKEGFDVKTTADTNLVMTSEMPFFKIVAQGSASINVTADGVYNTTIAHNLGYSPAHVHYVSVDPANPARRNPGRWVADGPGGAIGFDSYIDDTNLVMRWFDTTGGFFESYPYAVGLYYYIFWDEL